jgi:hypothetical protein
MNLSSTEQLYKLKAQAEQELKILNERLRKDQQLKWHASFINSLVGWEGTLALCEQSLLSNYSI